MAPLVGEWTASYTDPDTGAESYAMRVPLQKVRPALRHTAFVSDSLNYVEREVVDIGGVYEIVGVFRYEDDPQGLLDLVRAGVRGLTITLDDGTNSVDVVQVDPVGPDILLGFDVDQQAFDEHTVEVRYRRTTGAAFPSWVF